MGNVWGLTEAQGARSSVVASTLALYQVPSMDLRASYMLTLLIPSVT